MRILLIHNFYRSSVPSGENRAYDLERTLLQSKGHDLLEFTRFSDEWVAMGAWGQLKAALLIPWNPSTALAIRREVKRFRPDVVHAHNTFPMISPGVFGAIGHLAPKVLTLHNYRLFCPNGIPMRNGKPCTLCLDHQSSLPSLIHGCYRGGRLSTLPLAYSVSMHRQLGTWQQKVDAFIALTEFQRLCMVDSGLPAEKVAVKPNFYLGTSERVVSNAPKPYMVFVGRLTAEKGVRTLLRAWQLWGADAPLLKVVGDGPLRLELEVMARGLNIDFLGQMSPIETEEQISMASALILPSEWFEGLPMVLVEAYAHGTPVIASNLGPLPSLVRDGESGLLFESGSPESLLMVTRSGWSQKGLLKRLRRGARRLFEEKYTAESNHSQLMGIYTEVISRCRLGGGGVT